MKTEPVVGIDVALIERARRGDTKAFERLYREHVGRLHGLCLRMTRNPDLAADCVQDAFIKAWKALPKFEARSSFSTWLHRIAVNTVLEKRRGPANAEIVVEDPAAAPVDVEHVLVLDDWIDGLGATRRIRETEALREVPIVAITAFGTEGFQRAAYDAGLSGYLTKPIDFDRMHLLIARLLSPPVSGSLTGGVNS